MIHLYRKTSFSFLSLGTLFLLLGLFGDLESSRHKIQLSNLSCTPPAILAVDYRKPSDCKESDGQIRIRIEDELATDETTYEVLLDFGSKKGFQKVAFTGKTLVLDDLFAGIYENIQVKRSGEAECVSAVWEEFLDLTRVCSEEVSGAELRTYCSGTYNYTNCDGEHLTINGSNLLKNQYFFADDRYTGCMAYTNGSCEIEPSHEVYCLNYNRTEPTPAQGYPYGAARYDKVIGASNMGISELTAERINWVFCNIPHLTYDERSAVNDAVWGLLGQTGCNSICDQAKAAVTHVQGGIAENMVFYRSKTHGLQDFVAHTTQCSAPDPCEGVDITSIKLKDEHGNTIATVNNGQTYTFDEGDKFYFEIGFEGDIESVKFTLSGDDHDEIIEENIPFNYPGTGSFFHKGAGSYTLKAEAYSGDGAAGDKCDTKTRNFHIVINSDCNVDIHVPTPDPVCAGNSVTLTADLTNASNDAVVKWYRNDNKIGEGTSINVTPPHSKTYKAIVFDGNCQAEDEVHVTVVDIPHVDAGHYDPICEDNEPITLSGSPAGGTFSGMGVSDGKFNPSDFGPGMYNISYTYTDQNGCSGEDHTTIYVKASPDVEAGHYDPVCADDDKITLTGHPSGGTFSGPGVSNGKFDPTVVGPGTYTITYTLTQNGCTGTDHTEIVVKPTPDAEAGSYGPVCEDDGKITLSGSPSGGTFSGAGVSNGKFDPTAVGPGTYTITYTLTQNGCTATDHTEIVVKPTPDAEAGSYDPVCEDDGKITLSGSPNGGTFSGHGVSNGKFDPTAVGPGTYTITYTLTQNGCTGTDHTEIVVKPLPTVDAGSYNPLCEDEGSINLVGSPAGGTFSGTGVSGSTFSPSVAGPGLFTITYVYTDGSGCTNEATTQILVYSQPTVTIQEVDPVCIDNGLITLRATPAGGTFSGDGVSGNTFDPAIGAGTYTITYTYTDGNGCTNSDEATIVVNPLPTVDAGTYGPVCVDNGLVNLSGSPAGGTFSGQGVTGTTFNPAIGAGTYTITYTYTDGNGCMNSDETTIVVNPLPTVDAGTYGPVCVDEGLITLSGSPQGGTFSGDGVSGTTFDPAIGAGTYTITYTYTDGQGCANSDEATIVVNPLPTVDAGTYGPVCVDEGLITLSGSPQGGTFSGGGVSGTTFDPAIGSGTYTITYTYTDGKGCTNSDEATIVVNPLPMVDAGTYGPVCVDEGLITLSGSPQGGTFSGDGVSGTTFDPAIGSGTYTITYTYTDGKGCTNSDEATIKVNPLPTVDAGMYSPVCVDEGLITLSGSPQGGTFSGDGVSGTTFNPAIGAGMYTITYTYTDGNGCTNSDEATIVVNPLPTVDAGTYDPVCTDAGLLMLSGTPAGGTFTGEGVNGNKFDPATGAGTYTITYTYTDGNGCTNTDEATIKVNPLPTVDAGTYDPVCVDADLITLTGSPVGGTFTGNGVDGNQFDPAIGAGSYQITYSYTDENGCTNSDDVTIVVNPLPELTVQSASCSEDLLSYTVTGTLLSGVELEASFGTIERDGNSFTVSGVPAGMDLELSATNSDTDCESTLTVTAPDCNCPVVNAPVSGGNKTICADQQIPQLSASADDGLVIDWYLNAVGGTPLKVASTTFTPAGAGTYFAEARDPVSDCTSASRTPVSLTINPLPTVDAGSYGPVCVDNGLIPLTGSPAGGTFSGTGVSDNQFTPNVGPGSYTITYTYTDGNGCTNTDETTIVVNPLPNVEAGEYGPFCVDADAVTLVGSPVGGTFSGNGVSGNQFDPGTGAGTYEITYTYTDGNGCANTDQTAIVVNPLPVVDAGSYDPVCVDNGLITLTGTPVGGTFTGQGVSGNQFDPGIGQGTYLITYVYADGNGCVNSDQASIVVNPLPVVDAGDYGPFCVDADPVALVGSPAGGTFTGNGVSGNQFDPGTGAGTYEITYSYTDGNGCANMDQTTIVVNPLPVVDAGSYNPVCIDNGLITLTGSPTGGTFSGTGVSGNQFNPGVGPGSYTITYTYTDNLGCTNSDEATIVVNPLPTVDPGDYGPLCETDEAIPLVGNPSGGTFAGPGVIGNAYYPQAVGPGTYNISYTYTDGNTCTTTESTTIVVKEQRTAGADRTTNVCEGTILDLATILDGADPGGTFAEVGNTDVLSGSTFNTAGLGGNTYQFTYTVESDAPCESDEAILTVNVVTQVSAGQDVLTNACEGETIDLFALLDGADAGGTFTESTEFGAVNGGSANTANLAGETITVIYTVGNGQTCPTDQATITILINDNPEPLARATTPCIGETLGLVVDEFGQTGPYTYQWVGPDGFTSVVKDPSVANVTLANEGTYFVTVTDGNGCQGSTSVKADILELPAVSAGPDKTICLGETVTLTASGATTYSWSNGDAGASIEVSPEETTTYTVTGTSDDGCSATDMVTVFVNPLPVANAGPDQSICPGESVTLTASGGVSYLWSTGDDEASITLMPDVTTTYLVTVTDANSCMATDMVNVTVNDLPVGTITNIACSADLTTYTVTIQTDADIINPTAGSVLNDGGGQYRITGITAGQSIAIGLRQSATTCETSINVQAPDCSCPFVAPPISGGDVDVCEDAIVNGNLPPISATVTSNDLTVDWYDSPAGGAPLRTGSTTFFPQEEGTYYAQTRNTVTDCISNTRTAVEIDVLPATPTASVTDATVCGTDDPETPGADNLLDLQTLVTGFQGGFWREADDDLDRQGSIFTATPDLIGQTVTFEYVITGRGNRPGTACASQVYEVDVTIISCEKGALGDFVWEDTDEDGQQDPGEMGVSDITVNLYTCADLINAISTTTTDANGGYLFTDLDEGSYVVEFVLPSGKSFTTDNQGNDNFDSDAGEDGFTACIELDAGETNLTIDVGITPEETNEIGDYVWEDTDEDGQQDIDEPGVSGITVNLYTCADLENAIASTTTDMDGGYLFSDLPDGEYVVEFVLPEGRDFTDDNQGSDATDSDAGEDGFTACIEVSGGESNLTIDVGITPEETNEIGDYVWEDTDEDGQQDVDEPGVSGITVNLYTCADLENAIASTTTDMDGGYLFSDLPDGEYVVEFVLPEGRDFTDDNQGSDATDSDAGEDGFTACIEVSGGESDLTIDAGITPEETNEIGDYVWEDTDEDGQQDVDEPGVPGITVNLYICDQTDTPIATTITDENGFFLFTDLPDGSYTLEFVMGDGQTLTLNGQGGDEALDSNADPETGFTECFELMGGESNPTVDAGITPPTGEIGDCVWADTDQDGQKDPDEEGVPGIIVRLFDCDNMETPIATTMTDANGSYSFPNLPAGNYIVQFVIGNGASFTHDLMGDAETDSNADPVSGMTFCIELEEGEKDPTIDAGIIIFDPCDIETVQVSNVVCDDNGTPTDPSDDQFTFDLVVTGTAVSNGWTATDGNTTMGAYGESVTFGPYPISGGAVSFNVVDNNDADCEATVYVPAPNTCSKACELSYEVLNLACDDNGTPADASDDTYTFDLLVNSVNGSTGWLANDADFTIGNYGELVTFGPYSIDDLPNLSFDIFDLSKLECNATVSVEAPATCSDIQCEITSTVISNLCDDNGTPDDNSDDTYTFELLVEGEFLSGNWEATDANNTTGTYGEVVAFGPYPISGGEQSFTISDVNEPDCKTTVWVGIPEECSPQCVLDATIVSITRDDQGTMEDLSDDTFTFDVTVTGTNSSVGWIANDEEEMRGFYGDTKTFGPYAVSDGPVTFTISDLLDRTCAETLTINPPEGPNTTPECPEDVVNAVMLTQNVHEVDGTLELGDDQLEAADDVCWLDNGSLADGNRYFDVQSFTPSAMGGVEQTYTFVLLTNGNAIGALFQGTDLEEALACTNLIAPCGDNDADIGLTVESAEYPAEGGWQTAVRFTATLNAGATYTLLTTTTAPDASSDYVWLIIPESSDELTLSDGGENLSSITVNLNRDLICTDLNEILNNPASLDWLGQPDVSDMDLNVDRIEFTDQFLEGDDCETDTIVRSFVLILEDGSERAACEQQIIIRKPALADLQGPACYIDLDCGEVAEEMTEEGYPAPSLTGYPMVVTAFGVQSLGDPYCVLEATFTDQLLDENGCGDNYQVQRTWTVTGDCLNDGATATFEQIIRVGDFTGPVIACPVSNHYCPIIEEDIMLFSTDVFDCTATIEVPLPEVEDACSAVGEILTEVLAIEEDGDTENLVLVATIPSDATDRTLTGLEQGDYYFRYTAADECGNSTEQLCRFRVADLEVPIAICQGSLNISLGSSGLARAYVHNVDFGSYDNCEVVSREVRRKFMTDPVTGEPLDEPVYSEWGSYATFDCMDAGQLVEVELRITDAAGNEAICWSDYLIEDKIAPICGGLLDAEVGCDELPDDFDARDIEQLSTQFGEATVIDNCSATIEELAPRITATDGSICLIERRFLATDASGNVSRDTFTQVVSIVNDSGCSVCEETSAIVEGPAGINSPYRTRPETLPNTKRQGLVLMQNFPNPVFGETIIGFELPESGEATIRVFTKTGRLLKVIEGDYHQGYNSLRLLRQDLPKAAGTLYYQLDFKGVQVTRQMLIIE